ncbi:acyl carrier protein [Micromonospora sp. NPDC048830]|uniref:acyl carrier protein n=1 Tax=Micromonospora sp. NPDC048830 TaxID=3364257 RepID=UPI003711C39E
MTDVTPPTFEQLAAIVEDKVGLPPRRIQPDTVLSEVDIDSLSLIEVSLALEKQYGVHLETEDVDTALTARDLHDLVLAASTARP